MTVNIQGSFTIDESAGVQNTDDTTLDPIAGREDDNDDDVSLSTTGLPSAFNDLLFTYMGLDNTFLTTNAFAESADDFISISESSNVTDVNFTTGGDPLPTFDEDADYSTIPDTWVDSGLNTTAGDDIYLFSDYLTTTDSYVDDNDLSGKVAFGITADGTIAFALYLENTDEVGTGADGSFDEWKVTNVQFESIENPTSGDGSGDPSSYDEPDMLQGLDVSASSELFFNFSNTPAGKLYFAMYVPSGTAQDDANAIGIIATADDPPNSGKANDTTGQEKTEGNKHLNTSKGGGPTTHGVENQSAGENESLTYSLVVNPERDYVINQPTSLEDTVEGQVDGNSGPLSLESNIQFDNYFSGASGGFFTVVKIAGGGAKERTTINVAAYFNDDDEDKESNYDNSDQPLYTANGGTLYEDGERGVATSNATDGVRDGDEVLQTIDTIRVYKVALNKEGFIVDGSKIPLFDSSTADVDDQGTPNPYDDVYSDAASGVQMKFNIDGTVTITGVPENAMVEFDLADGDLWNMLEISKDVPDNNYQPFLSGQTYNIANVGVDTAATDTASLTGIYFEDDGPVAELDKNAGNVVELDETAGLQDGDTPTDDDLFGTDDVDEDDANHDVDGTQVFVDLEGTENDLTVAQFFDDASDGVLVAAGLTAVNATGSNFDSGDATKYAFSGLNGSNPLVSVGSATSVGEDDEGATQVIDLELNLDGLGLTLVTIAGGSDQAIQTDLTTTDGSETVYLIEESGAILGVTGSIDGISGELTVGEVVLGVGINQDGEVATVLYTSLDNGDSPDAYDEEVDLSEGGVSYIDAVLTVTDGDDDVAVDREEIGSQVLFEDDGPVAELDKNAGNVVELDETAGLQDGDTPTDDDLFGTDDVDEDDANHDVDGTQVFVDLEGTENDLTVAQFFDDASDGVLVAAGLTAVNATGSNFDSGDATKYAFSGLNGSNPLVSVGSATSVGEDDEGATQVIDLELNLDGLGLTLVTIAGGSDQAIQTDLTTTDGSETVYLIEESGAILGVTGSIDGISGELTVGEVVLGVGINQDGEVATVLYTSLDNGDSPDAYDEEVDLSEGGVSYIDAVLTVTDGDDDVAVDREEIGSQVLFEDDGPVAELDKNAGNVVELDETAGLQDGDTPTDDDLFGTDDVDEDDANHDVDGTQVFVDLEGTENDLTVAQFFDDASDGVLVAAGLTAVNATGSNFDSGDATKYAFSGLNGSNPLVSVGSATSVGEDDEGATQVIDLELNLDGLGLTLVTIAGGSDQAIQTDLTTTDGSETVYLIEESGAILGVTGSIDGISGELTVGEVVLGVGINQDGEVATVLYTSLDNGDSPDAYDEEVDLSEGGVSYIDAVLTVTDGDDDVAVDREEIGSQVLFEDDGPVAELDKNAGNVVELDETAGLQDGDTPTDDDLFGTDDVDEDDANHDVDGTQVFVDLEGTENDLTVAQFFDDASDGVLVAAGLTAVNATGSNFDSGDATKYAFSGLNGSNPLVSVGSATSVGEDDEGATQVIDLELNLDGLGLTLVTIAGGSDQAIQTDLTTTDGSETVYLIEESGAILGVTGSIDGISGELTVGEVVLGVGINQDGEVATVLYTSLDNGDSPDAYDEEVDLSEGGVSYIDAVLTVTDGDDDVAVDREEIGSQVLFEDDGPVAELDKNAGNVVELDETAGLQDGDTPTDDDLFGTDDVDEDDANHDVDGTQVFVDLEGTENDLTVAQFFDDASDGVLVAAGLTAVNATGSNFDSGDATKYAFSGLNGSNPLVSVGSATSVGEDDEGATQVIDLELNLDGLGLTLVTIAGGSDQAIQTDLTTTDGSETVYLIEESGAILGVTGSIDGISGELTVGEVVLGVGINQDGEVATVLYTSLDNGDSPDAYDEEVDLSEGGVSYIDAVLTVTDGDDDVAVDREEIGSQVLFEDDGPVAELDKNAGNVVELDETAGLQDGDTPTDDDLFGTDDVDEDDANHDVDGTQVFVDLEGTENDLTVAQFFDDASDGVLVAAGLTAVNATGSNFDSGDATKYAFSGLNGSNPLVSVGSATSVGEDDEGATQVIDLELNLDGLGLTLVTIAGGSDQAIQTDLTTTDGSETVYLIEESGAILGVTGSIDGISGELTVGEVVLGVGINQDGEVATVLYTSLDNGDSPDAYDEEVDLSEGGVSYIDAVLTVTDGDDDVAVDREEIGSQVLFEDDGPVAELDKNAGNVVELDETAGLQDGDTPTDDDLFGTDDVDEDDANHDVDGTQVFVDLEGTENDLTVAQFFDDASDGVLVAAGLTAVNATGSNFDSGDATKYAFSGLNGSNPLVSVGSATSVGEDDEGATQVIDLELNLDGLGLTLVTIAGGSDQAIQTDLTTTDGSETVYLIEESGAILGVTGSIDGISGELTVGEVVLGVGINQDGEVATVLYTSLDNGDSPDAYDEEVDLSEGGVSYIDAVLTVTDGDDDVAVDREEIGSQVLFEDDGPVAELDKNAGNVVELDETAGLQDGDTPTDDDLFGTDDVDEDDANHDVDGTQVFVDLEGTENDLTVAQFFDDASDGVLVAAGLTAVNATGSNFDSGDATKYAFSGLNGSNPLVSVGSATSVGEDDEGATQVIDLELNLDGLGLTLVTIAGGSDQAIQTDLTTTDGSETVYLIEESGAILGVTGSIDGISGELTVGEVVLGVGINQDGEVATVLYTSLDNGDSPDAYDEEVDLSEGGVSYIDAVLTVTDGDDDVAVDREEIGSQVLFEDDGPVAELDKNAGNVVELDETAGLQDGDTPTDDDLFGTDDVDEDDANHDVDGTQVFVDLEGTENDLTVAQFFDDASDGVLVAAGLTAVNATGSNFDSGDATKYAFSGLNGSNPLVSVGSATSVGEDDEGATQVIDLELNLDGLGLTLVTIAGGSDQAIQTDLTTTDGSETVYLIEESGAILGVTGSIDGISGELTVGEVVLGVGINQDGEVATVLYTSLDNGDSPDAYDEEVDLSEGGVSYIDAVLTVTDGDDDVAVDREEIGSQVLFEDDGPVAELDKNAGNVVELDETAGLQDGDTPTDDDLFGTDDVDEDDANHDVDGTQVFVDLEGTENDLTVAQFFDDASDGVLVAAGLTAVNATGSNFDSGDATKYAFSGLNGSNPLVSVGSATSVGEDDEGATQVIDLELNLDGLGLTLVTIAGGSDQAIQTDLTTTDGSETVYLIEESGAILGVTGSIDGISGELTVGEVVLGVGINQDGEVATVLYTSLDNGDSPDAYDEEVDLSEGGVSYIDAVLTVTDGDDDVAVDREEIGSQVLFEDDGPVAELDKNAGNVVELDETAGLQDGDTPTDDDLFGTDDVDEDDANHDVDGTQVFVDLEGTENDLTVAQFFDDASDGVLVAAGLTAVNATGSNFDSGDATKYAFSGLNGSNPLVSVGSATSVGEDDEGATQVIDLELNLDGLGLTLVTIAGGSDQAIQTDLTTTDGSETVYLIEESGAILGVTGSIDGISGELTVGEVVLGVGINQDGEVATVLYTSLDNGDSPDAYDEEVDLSEGGVSYIDAVLTVTDGDDDVAVDREEIGSQVLFEDDGPVAELDKNAGNVVELDETAGLQDGDTPTDDDLFGTDDVDEDDANHDVDGTQVFVDLEGTENDLTVAQFFDDASDGVLVAAGLTAVNATGSNFDSGDATKYAFSGLNGSNPLVSVGSATSVGEDDEGATQVIDLELNLDGLGLTLVTIAGGSDQAIQTDLTTTDGSETVYLIEESGAILGVTGSIDGISGELTVGEVVLGVGINQDGEVATVLYTSLDNGDSPDAYDEEVDLSEGGVSYIDAVLTVTDGDDDVAVDREEIGSQVLFEDDGPYLEDPEADPDTSGARDPLLALAASTTRDGFDPAYASNTFDWDPGEDDEGDADIYIVDNADVSGSWTDPATAFPQIWRDAFDGSDHLAGEGAAFTAALSADGKTLTYYDGYFDNVTGETQVDDLGDPIVRFTLTDNEDGTATWEAEVLQDAPLLLNELDLSSLEPGAPVEEVTFAVTNSLRAVNFNGLLWYDGTDGNPDAVDVFDDLSSTDLDILAVDDDRPDEGVDDNFEKQDNVNKDQNGLGIFSAQSSVMNPYEGFEIQIEDTSLSGDDGVQGFQWVINQNGNTEWVKLDVLVRDTNGDGDPSTDDYDIESVAFEMTGGGQASFDYITILVNDPDLIAAQDWDRDGTIEGILEQGLIIVDLDEFDNMLTLWTFYDGDPDDPSSSILGDNKGARIKQAFIVEETLLPDVELKVDIQGVDGDGDLTDVETVDFAIDGDGSGTFV